MTFYSWWNDGGHILCGLTFFVVVTCGVWGVWLYMALKPWAVDIKKRELDLLRRSKND